MILDSLDHAGKYVDRHPGFDAAFEFLRALDPGKLSEGRNPIDGDRIYAMVVRARGKGKAGTKLETHDKYVDIQYTVSGADEIGWSARPACRQSSQGYDPAKDLEFYGNPPEKWVVVSAGHFAVFFPADAHAPMGTTGPVDKVVVKVAVEW